MYIDKDQLLQQTNGGLEIIIKYYPDAANALQRRSKKFKIREEKTESASLKLQKDGNYTVTDFGDDSTPRNAIGVCAKEEGITYREALMKLAADFGIDAEAQKKLFRPEIKPRKPKKDEVEGELYYKSKEFTEAELKVLGPHVTADLCIKYNLKSVAWYGRVRDGEIKEIHATEHYPIFMFEFGTWRKLYQPKSLEKKFRFQYAGTRPKEVIVGYEQLCKAYDKLNEDFDVESEEDSKKKLKKLPEVIICSGERDALNIASLGYNVVWFNSESEIITNNYMFKLREKAEKVMNLPDLDATGIKKAHERAMQHLDLYTIELPAALKDKFDWRGNHCKDATDYVHFYKRPHFKQLVQSAMPYRMWDEKYTKEGVKYFFNHAHAYNFLQKNGFYRLHIPNDKKGYTYVKIEGSIVREVSDIEVKTFINDFIKSRNVKTDLRNLFFRSQTALSEKSLSNLDQVELDFTDYTKSSQFLFFKNVSWEVTKDGVTEHKLGTVGRYVWDDELIKHEVEVQDAPFVVSRDEETGDYSIDIKNKSCLFFKYLINTSRIYWQKEDDQNLTLTNREKHEQDHHLINKIYGLGYLLHRYKDPSRPWCIYAMDSKLSEDDQSHGGSGKSIAAKSVRHFMKHVTLDGRNAKLTENQHIYENVTEHTDYVLIDDANRYIDFDFFFAPLTGELTVNPKHGKQFVIPFENVPKFTLTSNFTLRKLDPSTERRLLYMVFSDYYHFSKDGEYEESRSPYDEFGKNLFQDFTEKEWNNFFNVMAHCLKTYLSFPKIDPPMENVRQRNLLTQMTAVFKEWADVYFSEMRLDEKVPKKPAFDDFKINATKHASWTANRFKKALQAWCDYYNFTMNPTEMCNNNGRIIERNGTETEEMIFIQTKPYESTSATVQPGDYEAAVDLNKF